MIQIQHIETIWTKKSRGMPEANKRNAVPRVLEIPDAKNNPTDIVVHKVVANEKNDFKLKHELIALNEQNKYWSFSFKLENDLLQVSFAYKYSEHGQPKRDKFRNKLFNLNLNEWGCFHINGRFTSYSGQHYRQHFVNIGNVENFNIELFVKSEPKKLINKMENLF